MHHYTFVRHCGHLESPLSADTRVDLTAGGWEVTLERYPALLVATLPACCGMTLLVSVERGALFVKPHVKALEQLPYLQYDKENF